MAFFDDLVNRANEYFGLGQPVSIKKSDFEEFTIEEQIELTRNPIKLKMVGNMMPMIPFEWGGELRKTETYYPGNPEPSVQILGSKEEPLTIKGRLHDKRQPNGSAIAYAVQEVLETIRKRGNLVRLSLGSKWVRYAYLDKTKFMMRDLNSIEYNLTFLIVSEKEPSQNPIITTRKSLPRDVNSELIKINLALKNNLLEYADSYPKNIFDQINDITNTVASKISLVTKTIDAVISTGEQASATLNRAVGLLAATRSFMFKSAQRIGMLNLDNEIRKKTLADSLIYKNLTTSYPTVTRQSITSGYASVKATQTTQRQIVQAQVILGDLQDQIRAYLESIPMARHLIKEGETLHTISIKYYATADNWEKIYKHNKLTSNLLVTGTVLEIPR